MTGQKPCPTTDGPAGIAFPRAGRAYTISRCREIPLCGRQIRLAHDPSARKIQLESVPLRHAIAGSAGHGWIFCRNGLLNWRQTAYIRWHKRALARSGVSLSADEVGSFWMSTFDKREDSFERKFAHDEELRFKAEARRNKLLGLWAAGLLGLSGTEAQEYAKAVVMADFEEAGEEDVFRKVFGDLQAASVDQSEHQVRRTMEELMAEAISQIKTEA